MREQVVVLDTETTGLDEEQDEVVQLCIRHGLAEDAETHLWNLKPTIKIPAEATATHGITDAMVANAPTFGEVAEQVRRELERGDVIIGYNPGFDIAMLKAEFRKSRCQVRWPPVVVCAKRLWDIYEPRPTRQLQDAYRRFVDPVGFEGAHGALPDTVATSKVIAAQVQLWGSGKMWHELDPERATWWGPSHHVVWHNDDLTINFGRSKGKLWSSRDAGFYRWIVNKDFPSHVRALAQQAERRQRSGQSGATLTQALNRWARDAAIARGWI